MFKSPLKAILILCLVLSSVFVQAQIEYSCTGMRFTYFPANRTNSEITILLAGANNSVLYIMNGELIELTAGKQPVGNYAYEKQFTNQELILTADTVKYMYSDVYAGQLVEPFRKKFKMTHCYQDLKTGEVT